MCIITGLIRRQWIFCLIATFRLLRRIACIVALAAFYPTKMNFASISKNNGRLCSSFNTMFCCMIWPAPIPYIMATCVNIVWSWNVCSQFFGPCSPKPLHFSITLLWLCLRAFNRFNCVPTKSRSLRKWQKTQRALLKIACNFCRGSLSFLNYYCANIAADPEVTKFAECLQ